MLSKIKTSALAFLFAGALSGPALASQGSGCLPTTGTVSGLTLVTDINAAVAALISSNSGSSAPATDCSGVSIAGQFWLDTSTSPPTLKNYDGTTWLKLGVVDSTNHFWTPPIGGGTNTLVAATSTDLGSVPQAYVSVTGNTTITGFGSSAVTGTVKMLSFTGTPQITYNASSMILPGAANITVVAGDSLVAVHLGSGNWRVISYTPISGQSVVNPSVPIGTMLSFAGFTAPSGTVFAYGQDVSRATFVSLLAALTSAQTGTRVSGSPIITSLTDTSQFRTGQKAEGTGIPAGASILTVDSSTQVTLSANATSSGSSTVTVFGYGNGDGSTTFTMPDCRGVVVAGRGNMGGSDRALLTSTYFGASGTGLGSFGGSQSATVLQANLPNVTLATAIASGQGSHTHTLVNASNIIVGSPSGTNTTAATGSGGAGPSIATATLPAMTGTTPLGGSGTPVAVVQPTLIANCIIKTN